MKQDATNIGLRELDAKFPHHMYVENNINEMIEILTNHFGKPFGVLASNGENFNKNAVWEHGNFLLMFANENDFLYFKMKYG